MADGLHKGEITLLDDYDLPLMERASQRMLENMHNQLAYQASHDDLTQLLNRKEFERLCGNCHPACKSGRELNTRSFIWIWTSSRSSTTPVATRQVMNC